MKNSLAAGLATARTLSIDRDRTIGCRGEDARVDATPMRIR